MVATQAHCGDRVAAVDRVWLDERSDRRGSFYRVRVGCCMTSVLPDQANATQSIDFLIYFVKLVGWS